MPGWEVWVTGGVVLFAIVIIGYLDWTSKNPGANDRGIPFPIRLLCFIFGLFAAGFGFVGILTTGGTSLLFVLVSVFLFVAAFIKLEKKPSAKPAQVQPAIVQPPVIQGMDENNELLTPGKLFVNLLHKPAFRVPFMLLCFGLFMWGAFLLAVNPSFLDNYGLIVILVIAAGFVGFRVLSIRRLIKTVNKTHDRK